MSRNPLTVSVPYPPSNTNPNSKTRDNAIRKLIGSRNRLTEPIKEPKEEKKKHQQGNGQGR